MLAKEDKTMSRSYKPKEQYLCIDKSSYIHPSAVVIGKVRIGKNVFVGPQAVIRADEPESCISIGNNCNIQDRVIIHSLSSSAVKIDNNSSLSHGCIIHGPCKIGKNCFIGFGSVVFNSSLSNNIFVWFLAVISGVNIPNNREINHSSVVDNRQKVISLQICSKQGYKFSNKVLKANLFLLEKYKVGVF